MLDDSQMETIDDLRNFIDGVTNLTLRPLKRDERSQWIRQILIRFKYLTLNRAAKQVVRQYLINLISLVHKLLGISRHTKPAAPSAQNTGDTSHSLCINSLTLSSWLKQTIFINASMVLQPLSS